MTWCEDNCIQANANKFPVSNVNRLFQLSPLRLLTILLEIIKILRQQVIVKLIKLLILIIKVLHNLTRVATNNITRKRKVITSDIVCRTIA